MQVHIYSQQIKFNESKEVKYSAWLLQLLHMYLVHSDCKGTEIYSS